MTYIIKWLITALSLLAVAYLFSGIHVASFTTAIVVAFLLGLMNTFIRPVLHILALPITIITFGLFALVVNGGIFWFLAKFVDGFSVDSFWWAVLGALFVSLFSSLGNHLIRSDEQ